MGNDLFKSSGADVIRRMKATVLIIHLFGESQKKTLHQATGSSRAETTHPDVNETERSISQHTSRIGSQLTEGVEH